MSKYSTAGVTRTKVPVDDRKLIARYDCCLSCSLVGGR